MAIAVERKTDKPVPLSFKDLSGYSNVEEPPEANWTELRQKGLI